MHTATAPTLALNDGHRMPQLGLGVWQSTGGDEITAVEYALTHGYRHIDTAAIYKNEAGVGEGIRRSGLARADLFITTKAWLDAIRERRVRPALEESLRKLGTDYVDLYLLHWHVDGGLEAWRALVDARRDGLVRSIGVSNYMPEHIDGLIDATGVTPAVNQIELHPRHQQREAWAYCRERDIRVTAWSPLMQGKFGEVPLLAEIGRRYGKSAPQVILRWNIDRGLITIPKSVTPARITENGDLFDFRLSADELAAIDDLDRGDSGRLGPDPRKFDF